MLILSRKEGQSIVVGDDLVLQIVNVKGGRVKVSIQGPPSIRIRRGELLARDSELQKDCSPHSDVGRSDRQTPVDDSSALSLI